MIRTKRTNCLRNIFGAIIIIPVFALLAGCGGGSTGTMGLSSNTTNTTNTTASMSTVDLYWDPSTSNTETGYKIYYGTSASNYTDSVDVGNTTSYTMSLTSGNTYYIAITAYNSSNNESGFSNELSVSL